MRQVAILTVLLLALLAAPAQAAPVLTVRYVGDIHGGRAYAVVSFERVYEYVVMAGRIESGPYLYTFKADIVGTSGYGDLEDHYYRARIRIQIRLTNDGFALIANPLGPGTPTTYHFKRY